MSIIGEIHEEWAEQLRFHQVAELKAILAWPLCDSAKVDALRWFAYRLEHGVELSAMHCNYRNALWRNMNPYLYMSKVLGL